MSAQSSSSKVEPGQLRPNSIGLPGVLFQSITTMAPASAVAFTLSPPFAATGITLPLAILIALVICSFIALSIGSLAKYLPSAGGYFTYVSNSLGVHVGWLVGWLFNLAYLLIVPFQLLVLGPVADQFANTYLHLSLGPNGWAIWVAIFAVVVFLLTYFGIKISADVGVVLGAIEITVFVILSFWLIFAGGSNNTLGVFNPANSLNSGLGGWQGVLLGMLFVFTAFSGFESSAPLAEETRNPRQTVPRAILLATVCIGLFYALCSYAAVVGWGPAKIGSYGSDANPWATMAKHIWGPFELIILLTILNSALANANAGVNAITRVLYAMGRTRTLPAGLAHLNRFHVPDIAIVLTMVIAGIASLVPGFVYDPTTAFALVGTILTFPILLVYMLTCVSVPVFYWRNHREEFQVLRHIIVPVIPLIVLAFVIVFQFIPFPSAPLNLAGPIVLVWLVIGIVIVVVLSQRTPETLATSSRVYLDGEEA